MSDIADPLLGYYYDGRQPVASPITLRIVGREALVSGTSIEQRYATRDLRVSPRVGRADRFIDLPNGGQVQCPDDSLLDDLPQEVPSEGPVAWLEQRQAVAVTCVAVITALLLIGNRYGLPALARHVASRIPLETERALGEQTLSWLDQERWLLPSALEPSTQAQIRSGFATLSGSAPIPATYQLEFRASKSFGANAFALPGGTIVITDDMVNLAESPDEVLAVLAHEIGHEQRHHAMRLILQSSAAAIVIGTVTADGASLGLAVTGLPLVLARTQYSREFETEADDFAFQLLAQSGRSPNAFATFMERLASRNGEDERRRPAFLSTHPVTADRVARARAAALAQEPAQATPAQSER